MKICIQCNIEKELVYFYKDKRIKGGYRTKCKECVKDNNKKWAKNNPEKVKERQKKWIKNNPEKVKEMRKKYRQTENRKDYLENWNMENPDYHKNYNQENKEKISIKKKEYKRKWLIENPDYHKNYYNKNKKEIYEKSKDYKIEYNRKYKKEKLQNDPVYKLYHYIGSSLRSSLKRNGYKKSSRTYEIIGCSFDDFKILLESKFENWMGWDNYGKYNGELNYGWDIDHIIPTSIAKTEEELLKLWNFNNLQPLCSKVNRDIKRDKLNYTI